MTWIASLPAEAITAELERIVASRHFRASGRLTTFLRYTVGRVLAGEAHVLKEVVIATEALGKSTDFDVRPDPRIR